MELSHIYYTVCVVLKARTETGRSNLTLFFLYLPSPPTTFFLFFDSKAKLLNMDLHKDTVNINRFENIFFIWHPSYGSCSLEMTDNFKALFLECFVKTIKLLCPLDCILVKFIAINFFR